MAAPTRPPKNSINALARRIYNPLGFNAAYNFILWHLRRRLPRLHPRALHIPEPAHLLPARRPLKRQQRSAWRMLLYASPTHSSPQASISN